MASSWWKAIAEESPPEGVKLYFDNVEWSAKRRERRPEKGIVDGDRVAMEHRATPAYLQDFTHWCLTDESWFWAWQTTGKPS